MYQIRYHMVFCIKYRQRLLSVEAQCAYLKQVLKEIAERYWFEMEEMGTDGDHVHLFVGAAPKYAPSRVMQILKSISARQMFIQFPEIRKQLWGGEFWSDGGYIGTVGDGVNSEIVKRYIQEQGSKEAFFTSKTYQKRTASTSTGTVSRVKVSWASKGLT